MRGDSAGGFQLAPKVPQGVEKLETTFKKFPFRFSYKS